MEYVKGSASEVQDSQEMTAQKSAGTRVTGISIYTEKRDV